MNTSTRRPISARGRAARLVVASAALCTALALGVAARPGDQGELERARAAVLEAVRALGEGTDPALAAGRLAPRTAVEARALLELVAAPAAGAEDPDPPLAPWRVDAAHAALAAAPLELLRPALAELAAEPFAERARSVALFLLARTGVRADLRLAAALAAPADARRPVPRALRATFVATVKAIAARAGAGEVELAALVPVVHAGLRAPLVGALAAGEPAAALRALAPLVGVDPELDPVLLDALARAGTRLGRPAEPDVRAHVRARLSAVRAPVAQAAARCAGALGDDEAIEDLVALLEHEEPSVARAAGAALRRITGLALPADRARWERWLAGEVAWWRERAAASFDRLLTGGEVEAHEALRELARRRLFRREIDEVLVAALKRREPELAAHAALVLAQHGATQAVGALVRCLDRPHPDVRRAAWSALVTLTGDALPPDPSLWRQRHGHP